MVQKEAHQIGMNLMCGSAGGMLGVRYKSSLILSEIEQNTHTLYLSNSCC